MKILSESDILPFLIKSFCKVETIQSENNRIIDRTNFNQNSNLTFSEVLDQVVSDEQLDYTLEQVTSSFNAHYIDQDLSVKLLKKSNQIANNELINPIKVEIFIEVLGIDIPDNSKDEIELELFIHTYTNKKEMFDFLISRNLCEKNDAIRILKKWSNKNYYYPQTQVEEYFISKILDVELEGYYLKEVKEVHYNIQFEETIQVSRSKRVLYKIKNSLNTRRFPFDVSNITLEFALASNFDITEVMLIPEISNEVKKSTPFIYDSYRLRGFNVVSSQSEPICVGYFQSSDYYLQNLSIINISLKRDSNAFIIRTFIPACIIQLIAIFATYIYFYDNSFRDSIVMSVIPSILLTEIIQHSTINSHVPTRSGKTLIDMFFVRVYLSLMFFFMGLTLSKNIVLCYLFIFIGSITFLYNFIKIGKDIYNHHKDGSINN